MKYESNFTGNTTCARANSIVSTYKSIVNQAVLAHRNHAREKPGSDKVPKFRTKIRHRDSEQGPASNWICIPSLRIYDQASLSLYKYSK
jgi:hypothetical protein